MIPIPIPKSHLAASLSLHDDVIRWSLNTRIRVSKGSARGCLGTVKATVQTTDGILWIGLALDEPLGRHDGCTSSGERHFHCTPNHGLYVRADKGFLEAVYSTPGEALDVAQAMEEFVSRMSVSLREDTPDEPEMNAVERKIGSQPTTPQPKMQWGTSQRDTSRIVEGNTSSDESNSRRCKNRWMSSNDFHVSDWRKARLQELYAEQRSPR